MFGLADNSPQPADNEAKDTHGSPACDFCTVRSNVCDDTGRSVQVQGSAAHGRNGAERTASNEARSHESPGRTAVEKIHLLPVSEEAPKAWVFATLKGFMNECTTVRQYMYVRVNRPDKDSKLTRKLSSDDTDSNKATNSEYTYIVVACLPHSGMITPSTIVFTAGSPLKPLRRVQLLALIHPNSAYARRAGVSSYSEALQRGLVGEASASSRSSRRNNRNDRREGGTSPPNNATASSGSNSVGAYAATDEAASQRRNLGSPFNWGGTPDASELQHRRRGLVREYNSAEDVIAAVFGDSGPDSDGEGREKDDAIGGGAAFRLSDAEARDTGGADTERPFCDRQLQHQRTLQRNFNFPSSSSGTPGSAGGISREADDSENVGIRSLSERVLFYDFVAPYFHARSAGAFSPTSLTNSGAGGASRDTAVVVFPGKKLVIKDLTFVVWATDPDNAPGFLRKDTAVYISVDPWGEYRRVHILPFADTLPTTYAFRLFEDYLQPFLKEQPWRLIRKGDIFSFSLSHRGVEFKVIATEPPTVPVARVGPETMVHFEGTLNPSLIDILPPEVLIRVRRLPARVQPFAIIAAAQSLDPQLLLRVLPSANMRGNQRGIDEGLEAAVERQLVRPFCLSEYQEQYAHLCTRKSQDDTRQKRHEHEVEGECTARQPYSIPPRASSTNPEVAAAVAEAAASGWELEAPCCTVCTLQLQDGAQSLTLTCGHPFHWGCARAWLRCSATCPNCRAEVVLPSGDGESVATSAASVGTAALGFVRSALADFFST